MSPKHIVVSMSGGVDSSVTAYLLKQQGHHVTGVFMKNWEEDDTNQYCSAAKDIADAQSVCDKIDIELKTINFAAEYWDNVFEHFLAEYQAGRTPNPDILCNQEIKFKAFLEYAAMLSADAIATGHYAQIDHTDLTCLLKKGIDPNKDQSYFLYRLNQTQLNKSIFPLGQYHKTQIRKIAKEIGLENHAKKDSTGICFIGERKFKAFLSQYLPAQPGEIITESGQVIGQHDGLMYYTIGQRQGLHIGGVKGAQEAPWFVAEKDLDKNQLLVVQGTNHPALFKSTLTANQTHWINDKPTQSTFYCTAKTRYRQTDQTCQVTVSHDETLTVQFDQPQRAITPGQSVVLYQQNVCLGGGVISQRTQ